MSHSRVQKVVVVEKVVASNGGMMEITAVWLQAFRNQIEVLIEVNGEWYKIVNELHFEDEGIISYCAHTKDNLPSNAVRVDFEKQSPPEPE